MANELTRVGYGQVEPNHLSAQRTGQIYAQLPVNDTVLSSTWGGIVENGVFAKYDYAAGEVNVTDGSGTGEWMLVYNEEKLYEAGQTRKDFALLESEAVDDEVTPRLFKTNVGDIYTTNCVDAASGGLAVVGAYLTPGADGYLEVTTDGDEDMLWKVVAVTTMPDAQTAVKIQRVK
jgi:hypothetical protein